MAVEQLSLWDLPSTDEKFLWLQLEDLREKQNNLRRGLFVRFDKLKTEIDILKEEMQAMKIQKSTEELEYYAI